MLFYNVQHGSIASNDWLPVKRARWEYMEAMRKEFGEQFYAHAYFERARKCGEVGVDRPLVNNSSIRGRWGYET